ncbi:MAG: MltA domain-containing protein [Deltaproteobacteria bacterium]|nr:MltA domain-containing protein [Deltaproteobacteria bacterium]
MTRSNRLSSLRAAAFCLWLLMLASGCTPLRMQLSSSAMIKIQPAAYPIFEDSMSLDGLHHGIVQSLSYLKRVPESKKFIFGKEVFDTSQMIHSLEAFLTFLCKRPTLQAIQAYINENCWVYQSVGAGKPGRVLFTGYYEPLLEGRRKKDATYRYPLYARPEDHVTINLSLFSPQYKGIALIGRISDHEVVPYHDRQEIDEKGVLEGKAKVLAWLKDPVDLFFLQIQGSGKVYLDTGQLMNVHYHTTNGHPYRSIGKLLIEEGKIPAERMSMQAIRTYLHDHPTEVGRILNHNPSYVFFKTEKQGPIGYMGVRLTPGRSLALDRRLFPPAALVFIKTKQPLIDGSGKIHRWVDFTGFALNQDTGGAIRGPGRADLFWGNGPYAEIAAGHMQHEGQLYFLVLKPKQKR